jgi:hypothetical protein
MLDKPLHRHSQAHAVGQFIKQCEINTQDFRHTTLMYHLTHFNEPLLTRQSLSHIIYKSIGSWHVGMKCTKCEYT